MNYNHWQPNSNSCKNTPTTVNSFLLLPWSQKRQCQQFFFSDNALNLLFIWTRRRQDDSATSTFNSTADNQQCQSINSVLNMSNNCQLCPALYYSKIYLQVLNTLTFELPFSSALQNHRVLTARWWFWPYVLLQLNIDIVPAKVCHACDNIHIIIDRRHLYLYKNIVMY